MTADIARIIGKLTNDIAKLQRAVSALRALGSTDAVESASTKKQGRKKGYKLTAEQRQRMSIAAKLRYQKANQTPDTPTNATATDIH